MRIKRKPIGIKALEKAIKLAGGVNALASALGIKHPGIIQWRLRGVPAERAHQIAKLTGVPVHELRPDLWSAQ